MNESRPWRALFLCTANSARSILAEAALQRAGSGRFEAYSAGSHPRGQVNPTALAVLEEAGFDPCIFRSKSWDEFATPGTPAIDFVITLCDSAAGEVCPVWPGHPVRAHWGLPDPAGVADAAARHEAFRRTLAAVQQRIEQLLALPLETLDTQALRERLNVIGTLPAPDFLDLSR